jgi:hypothetical protein
MKLLLISPNCVKCRELLENSLFRQFVSELVKDGGMVVVGDEAYLFGFDYNDKNLLFGGIGYETPSIIDLRTFDSRSIHEFTVNTFVSYLRKMPRSVRSRSSESRARRRKSESEYNEFVKAKQLKKELKKAMSCEGEGDVCREI